MTYLLIGLAITAAIALLGAVNAPAIKGVTTIVWGTEGQLGAPSGAIVESIDLTPQNAGGLGTIENGDGATVADILLDDGFDAKVTCVYDKAKTWPVVGGPAITLTMPTIGGAGGTTAYTCYLTGPNAIKTARKKEATIELSLRFRPGIAS